jgi:hypothetical protein
MDDPILKAKLDRIGACVAEPAYDEVARNLLHAYVACLTPDELCEATVQALNTSTNVLSAIRTRLSRLGEAGSASDQIDSLGLRLIGMTGTNGTARVRIDSLLSLLYPYLAPPTYAYLCAKLGHPLSDQEALEIVEETDNGSFGDRGLAIWAIGQLGMASVLDRIWSMRPEFEKRKLRGLGIFEDDKDAD